MNLKEYFYNKLSEGVEFDTLYDTTIDALDEVYEVYVKELEAAAAQKAAEEIERKTAAQGVADSINAYLSQYYNYDGGLNAEDLVSLGNLLKNFKVDVKVVNEPAKKGIKVKAHNGTSDFNPDKTINDFLSAFGLK